MAWMGAFELTEEEKKAVVFEEEEFKQGLNFAVVGRVLTKRQVNLSDLSRALGRVWAPSKTMMFMDLGDKLVLFDFEHREDREKVLGEGPWSFDNRPVVLVEYDGCKNPADLNFSYMPMWVRIFGLPANLMNRKAAMRIGGALGEVLDVDVDVDVDVDEDGCEWGEFVRVRVKVDITKPIRRVIRIKTPLSKGPKGDWFRVQYEKLPHLCSYCGVVGHETCSCKGDGVKHYGEELRAPLEVVRGGERGEASGSRELKEKEVAERRDKAVVVADAFSSTMGSVGGTKDGAKNQKEKHSKLNQPKLTQSLLAQNSSAAIEQASEQLEERNNSNSQELPQVKHPSPKNQNSHKFGVQLRGRRLPVKRKRGAIIEEGRNRYLLSLRKALNVNIANYSYVVSSPLCASGAADREFRRDGSLAEKKQQFGW